MALRPRIARKIEKLEARALFALAPIPSVLPDLAEGESGFQNPWHNAELPNDVNVSHLVDLLDALAIINNINQAGIREVANHTPKAGDLMYDVNNDLEIDPLDVLQVINAINSAMPDLNIAMSLGSQDDLDSNGVVQIPNVSLGGQTSPFSKVQIQVRNDAIPLLPIRETVADSDGFFAINVELPLGVNVIQFQIKDPLGRTLKMERELRVGDVIANWNASILNAIRDWTTTSNDPYEGRIVASQPPRVAKNLAMIHLAMFDAINAVQPVYEPIVKGIELSPSANAIVAGATAAHRVASALYFDPDERAVWDATLRESLLNIPEDDAYRKGVLLGVQVANAVLALRVNDGANAASTYVPTDSPGHWNRTEPDLLPPLLPQWPKVRPFAIPSGDAFRPAPPPALDTQAYAEAVDQVMQLGGFDSQVRTTEQTEIAIFWADGGGTATPPGHWNQIASDVLMRSSVSLLDNARTMALLNIAMADAGIAAWDAKYVYDLWRPIDAIRDSKQAGWTPLIKTPPFPTYVSGHSTFSGAASEVLQSLLGEVSFTSSSDGHTGLTQRPIADSGIVTRHFANFQQAAAEAGMSRIYGGIHFDFDNEAGLNLGQEIGVFVSENVARKLPSTIRT